jgi:hypothetical protein
MAFTGTASGLSTLPDDTWREDAACTQPGVDPEVFFPIERGSSPVGNLAKAICYRCQVRADCYQEFVIDRPQEFGVYAGLTAAERKIARARHFGRVVPV